MGKKDREKAQAYSLFVDGGKNQKEIAELLGVSEKTVSKWANDGHWKNTKAARTFSESKLKQNSQDIMVTLSDMMLEVMRRRDAILKMPEEEQDKNELLDILNEIKSLADAMSKAKSDTSKTEKANAISYITYLNVCESIFSALFREDPKLHAMTMDFQERHIQEMAKILH